MNITDIQQLRHWENQPAEGVDLDDLDHEEILRTRDDAIRRRNISAGTSMDVGDILDRLGLRSDGVISQAALALYGKPDASDYPQFLLKMGRFRGTKITGDILHNRQEHMNAFAMMREGMAFLDRILPLAAHFPKGKIQREDRLPVPADALREILLNAIIHRNYSPYWGYVAIAVLDDRIEIISSGLLPPGITVEMLSGPHLSKLRNPKIAETFHRVGAIEAWGRGTNRVIAECRKYSVDPPAFREESGMVVVTFKAAIGPASPERHESRHEWRPEPNGQLESQLESEMARSTSHSTSHGTSSVPEQYQSEGGTQLKSQPESQPESRPESQPESKSLRDRVLRTLDDGPVSKSEMARILGQKTDSGQLRLVIHELIVEGLIALTIPDKPNSRLQKYRRENKEPQKR